MNRLSFLKTISMGIAAAVIIPGALVPKELDPKKYPLTPDECYYICCNDLCIDKKGFIWVVTAVYMDEIELKIIQLYTNYPSTIIIKQKDFPEYFYKYASTHLTIK
jgi:hypothetical protein